MQSLEELLRVTLPASFATRYSRSAVDAENREALSNTSVRPTDRRISGSISLDLPGNRLGLNIVAYRSGGSWLPFVPATLIVFLTLLATATLLQLRRHARGRAETEEQLRAAYAFRQAMSQSLVTGLRAVDLEGRITFVNTAFCRMTGFAESELIGVAPPYPYWPPDEFDQLRKNIDQAPAPAFEMRIMRKNGIEAMRDTPFKRRHLEISARQIDARWLQAAPRLDGGTLLSFTVPIEEKEGDE